MAAQGLDHVNILTDDLEATVAFYAAVLDLREDVSPIAVGGRKGAWLRDAAGNAIVHLVYHDGTLPMYAGHAVRGSTNAVHHVAFRCTGFRESVARIAALGIEARVNEGQYGLWQIFITDPNGVNVEMTFSAQG